MSINFYVRSIGGEYQEMKVDAIDTGTMDKKQSVAQAREMIIAASELLFNVGLTDESADCSEIEEDLSSLFPLIDPNKLT